MPDWKRLGLCADVPALDLVGQGRAAALPKQRLGHALLASVAGRRRLSICVEVGSAAMYLVAMGLC